MTTPIPSSSTTSTTAPSPPLCCATTTTKTKPTPLPQQQTAASVLTTGTATSEGPPCAVVMHNTTSSSPQLVCRAHHHFPAHMLALCPFTRPFTFGTDACQTKTGSHVGMAPNSGSGDGPVLGTMLGNKEFMVLADSTFIVCTPAKDSGGLLTLHDALLPHSGSHTIQFGRKGQSYPMQAGSVLLAQSDLTLRSATVFLADRNQYNRTLYQSLQWSLVHFIGIHRRIVVDPDRAAHPFFTANPTKPLRVPNEWGVVPSGNPSAAQQTDGLRRILLLAAEQPDHHTDANALKRKTRLAAAALLDFCLEARDDAAGRSGRRKKAE